MIVATPAPHNPWRPAAKYAAADVGRVGREPRHSGDRSLGQASLGPVAELLPRPGGAVRIPQLRTLKSVDDMVDTVMTRVQQLGELSDTLVIYTSDNGYLWGEHHLGGDYGLAVQKRYPYTESVRLPLFIRWDGHVQPGTIDPGSPERSTSCPRSCRPRDPSRLPGRRPFDPLELLENADPARVLAGSG